MFWGNCQETYGTIRVWRRGSRLWHSLLEVYCPVVKAGYWDPQHSRAEESVSKKPHVGFSSSCLRLFSSHWSPLRQVLCRKRNPCWSSLTLASEGRQWGCGWDAINDQLAPECQSKVSSDTLRHNPIDAQGAKGRWGPLIARYGQVYQEELV